MGARQPSPVSAQQSASPVFENVQVDVWPEYDQPAVLVIYHITISTQVTLPANLSIRIPAAAGKPFAVAMQDSNGLYNLNYDLGAGQGIFGSYSESMRAPTSIELSCADPNSPCSLPTGFNGDPDLKAVVAKTIEFGGRGKLGKSTYWSAAVYDSRLSNDIQFIATSNTYGYFANVGKTERRGMELGASTKIDKWSLSEDGKTVTILRHYEGNGGPQDQKLLFDKQPAKSN